MSEHDGDVRFFWFFYPEADGPLSAKISRSGSRLPNIPLATV
ncbi:hypothetical protein [Methylobacterium nigriterrae]